jgi:hypothetical protein
MAIALSFLAIYLASLANYMSNFRSPRECLFFPDLVHNHIQKKRGNKMSGIKNKLNRMLSSSEYQPKSNPKSELMTTNMTDHGKDIFSAFQSYFAGEFSDDFKSERENARMFLKGSEFNIMLRYKPLGYLDYKQSLVIAVLAFTDSRAGHGTNLMNFIHSIAGKFELEHIIFECVGTESRLFAEAHDFVKTSVEDVLVLPLIRSS